MIEKDVVERENEKDKKIEKGDFMTQRKGKINFGSDGRKRG